MTDEDWKFAVLALSSVFFVIDPLANVPIFLTITSRCSPAMRRRIAAKAAFATWVTLTIFAVAGGLIFKAFGISLGAFKIAGGIMLLLMAIDMMRAQPSPTRTTAKEQDESLERGDDIAIFPLAVPMLAGPGAIASIMLLEGGANGLAGSLVVLAALLVVLLLTLLALLAAAPLMKLVGVRVEAVVTRLLGVLLAALAAQYVIDGLRGSFSL